MKPLVNSGLSDWPAAWVRKLILPEPGRSSRFAKKSYTQSPARIIQAGRCP